MKTNTHPNYTSTAIVCNTCKTEYRLGSTTDGIKVELCANCHPFYTGKETLVDTDNLVDKFNKKKEMATTSSTKKKKKKEKLQQRKQKAMQARNGSATSLKDMLAQIK